MKIINFITFDRFVTSKEIYSFLHQNYQYTDAIEVDIATIIEDLIDRKVIDEPTDIFKFFGDIFSNDYYKNNVTSVSSPAMIFELYEYILSKCRKSNNGIPCIAESGSFLDICYHYSIPIFINDWSIILKQLLDYDPQWVILDSEYKDKMRYEYYVVDYYAKNFLSDGIPNHMPALKDFYLENKYIQERFEEERKNYIANINLNTPYTNDSLTYLYEELIG